MLGLLPWERWLPPQVYGPLIAAGSIWALSAQACSLAWWEWVLFGLGAVYGVGGTVYWAVTRRNLFDNSPDERRKR